MTTLLKHRRHRALVAAGTLVVAVLAVISLGRQSSLAAQASPAPQGGNCLTYGGIPEGFGRATTAGMLRVPSGSLSIGSEAGYADEKPSGVASRVKSFWIDRTEVTNAQFAAFVAATGYVTAAEREGASAVFRAPAKGKAARGPEDWWSWIAGASWRHPEGAASAAVGAPSEPVVLVTVADAVAYAAWLGHDLPSEAEWEWAARGGGKAEMVDREPRDPTGRPTANYWQGLFPDINSKEDGFAALAPVGCFATNGYGIADMIGNVWELTRDRYTGSHQAHGNGDPGGAAARAGAANRKGEPVVIKGGSFLCAASYCLRYRASARYPHEADLATSHVGFRTVLRENVLQP